MTALLLALAAHAQDVSLHETLYTTTSADSVSGGTFTGSGWRIDDSGSKLYWDLGTQLAAGDISVTIDDISWDNLQGANNHLLELFSDGGHSSDNRAINLRLYGEGDGDPYGEWGDLKLLAWDRTTNPGGDDLVAEQRYYGLDWDGLPHTWRITWDESDFALYRDGAELIRMDVTGMDMRVRYLWIPLQDWGGDYSAPVGSVYSNLDLDGWEGTDDVDPDLPDDGDPNTFLPTDDVTAASWEPNTVFSDTDDLIVEAGAAMTYLKFDLSSVSGTVTSATLHMRARGVSEASGDGGQAYAISDTSWTEDSLTWNNRPALGSALGAYPAVSPNDEVAIDVTAGVRAGGQVALALAMTEADSPHFSSKEDGDGSGAPILEIVVENSGSGGDGGGTDAGGGVDDGAGTDDGGGTDDGAGDDADPQDTGGRGAPAGESPGSTGDMSGACACDGGATGAGWLAITAALAATRRRRPEGGSDLRRR
jgi:hypothetical protein